MPLAALFLVAPRGGARAGDEGAPAAPFTPRPVRERLVVVGIDGLDGALVEAMSGRGAVDRILSILARGAVWPKVRPSGLEPPEVWTTVLTGMPAADHGVRSVGATRRPGVAAPLSDRSGPLPLAAALKFVLPARTVPATGAGRRVRTLAEIVGMREPAASPTVVVAPTASVFVERSPPAEAPAQVWRYWCNESRAYYPYVKECPAGWQRVAPQTVVPADRTR